MTTVQIKSHAGTQIRSFLDWEKHSLPDERKQHWKEGRSACELGQSWTAAGEPSVPPELAQLLESHEGTRGIVILSGITEHETPLPFGNRGPRCHDLALRAEQDGHAVTVCIEAKADESFGGTVAKELLRARTRARTSKQLRTRFPERLDWLTRSLLGFPAFEDEKLLVLSAAVAELPYQLLSAIGGTLLEAEDQNAAKAVFVVHEFRTAATEDSKLSVNATALNIFLRRLLSANNQQGDSFELRCGQIIGPVLITDRPVACATKIPYHVPLFIGKIRTDRLG
jgi:hypothetical protein